MPRIHCLDHIDCLRPPDFPYYDPVRAHPEAGLDQLSYADGPAALDIGVPGFHLHQIRHMADLQFRIVLYGDDPLSRVDAVGQHVQEGRFS